MAESVYLLDGDTGYSSFAAFEAAHQSTDWPASGNNPVLECSFDVTESVNLSAWTLSATYPLVIRAAAGSENGGDKTAGFCLTNTTTWTPALEIDTPHVLVENIRIYKSQTGAGVYIHSEENVVLDGVLVEKTDSSSTVVYAAAFYTAASNSLSVEPVLRNCLSFGGNIGYRVDGWNNAHFYNCNAVDAVAAGFSLSSNFSTIPSSVINCAAYNCGYGFSTNGKSFDSASNNASSDGTVATLGIGTITNITSAEFLDAANDDYHLAAGSQLIGAGADLSAYFTDDIDGDTRSSWDIGFDEYVAAGGGAVNLTINDSLHSQTVDPVALTQAGALAVNESQHAHTADSMALSQAGQLSVTESSHAHIADNLTLSQSISLAVAETITTHAVDNIALVESSQLLISESLHSHLAGSPVLSQSAQLPVAGSSHAHTVDNLTISQGGQLSLQEALHAHAVDQMDLTQANNLVIDATVHNQTADQVVLSFAVSLSPAAAAHGHVVDQLNLIQAGFLVVADSQHNHQADIPALSQAYSLAINETLHDHLADSPVIYLGTALSPDPALHAQVVDGLVLSISQLITEIFNIPAEVRVYSIDAEKRVYLVKRG